MRKGVYAFLKENSNGTMNIDVEYADGNIINSIENFQDKTMSESLTRRSKKYSELCHKSRFVGERKPLLDGICNITSREEFIRLVSMLAKSCKSSRLQLYVFQDGKIIYTTDKDISLVEDTNKEVDFGILNKAATEALIRSYR